MSDEADDVTEQGGQDDDGATPPVDDASTSQPITMTPAQLKERLERAKPSDYDELKEKAVKYDEVVETSKTNEQKQADALAAAQAKVTEYETREQLTAWTKEVSTETGVRADLLRGSSKEELLKHAEELKPFIAQSSRGPIVESQGVQPSISNTASPDDWLRAAANS